MNFSNQTKCIYFAAVLVLLVLVIMQLWRFGYYMETLTARAQPYVITDYGSPYDPETGASPINPENPFVGLTSTGQISSGSEFNIRAQQSSQPQLGESKSVTDFTNF